MNHHNMLSINLPPSHTRVIFEFFSCYSLERVLLGIVLGSSRSRALGGYVGLAHTTINGEVMSVDEAGLIAGQEDNSVSLLNGLTEATGGEVNLTAITLLLVITEPVLKQGRVEGSRAQRVEAETFPGVDHGQLTGHSKNGALGGGVGELGSGSTNHGDDGGGVDNGTACFLVAAKRKNGMLAAVPDTLHIDVLGQVPNILGGVDGVIVLGVHDTGVVEDDVEATPGVDGVDHGLNFALL